MKRVLLLSYCFWDSLDLITAYLDSSVLNIVNHNIWIYMNHISLSDAEQS